MLKVRIIGPLWENLAPKLELDLEGAEITAADLITRLGIDPAEVGIITVDGRQSQPDAVMPKSGRVCIFSPMSGG